ncbi:hypothetical protein XELAEV_18043664mg [Xenopus laevis]|uniref:ABC-2 type transporter transmembrane domain-containing protein n=1 Tax=Xenopus laevis TaxID=8355 RepID=A0A974H321_XENLA|nr:hypothetical protein XELAEV_18043664mg [Xenopus laevis]
MCIFICILQGDMNPFHTSYITMSFFMIFASGLSPHIAMSSTEDNRINARTQLRVSSLFPSAYWFGQALVDVILYWILLFLMLFIYFAFNSFFLLDFVPAMVMITGIIGYGMAMILYVYVICFIFGKGKSHNDSWSLFFVIGARRFSRYASAVTPDLFSCHAMSCQSPHLIFLPFAWR